MSPFTEVRLTIGREAAMDVVRRTAPSLNPRSDDGTTTFRTNAGLVVCSLTQDITDPEACTLRYRTGPHLPHLRHAAQVGRSVGTALEEYRDTISR